MNRILRLSALLLVQAIVLNVNAQLATTPLGTSGNVLSVLNENSTMLDVNNSLNSVMFIHRNNPNALGGGGSLYRIDVSRNGGTTWSNNLGPVNTNAALDNTAFARFPQGIIFNPTNNTIADSAYVIYSGTYHDNVNWAGQNRGRGKLTGLAASYNSSLDPINSGHTSMGASLCQGAAGVFWSVNVNDATGNFNGTPSTYTGISVQKGVYNSSTRAVTWTTTTLPASFVLEPNSNTSICTSWNIAFDPTGQYGWISVLGDITADADSVYNPIFWKTTNGGTSWTGPIQVDLDNIAGVKDYLDSLNYVDGSAATRNPSTTFESDLSVDANGNPHLLCLVGSGTQYSVQLAGYSVWDITYTASGTCNWQGIILDKIYTLRGTYSNVNDNPAQTDDNRPQISRSQDGTKMFFFWTATDAVYWNSLDNDHPNLFVAGLNVTQNTFTGVYNLTEGDSKWGGATSNASAGTYGGAPYSVVGQTALSGTGTYTIPLILTQMDYTSGLSLGSVSANQPAAYFYESNLTFGDGDFLYYADRVNPTMTLNGSNPMNLTVGQAYNEPGATASDCVDGNITPVITGNVNTNAAGTYIVQYVATDVAGNSDTLYRTVIVSAGSGSAPTVVTNAATSITAAGATLNGTVNANSLTTATSFQYGLTTSYGSTATASPTNITGSTTQNISATISGLSANTTYHFRAAGTNTSGTNYGIDRTFTTLASGTPCTPNSNTTQGLEPKAANVGCITQGNGFSQVYTFVVPSSVNFGTPIPITSMTIDSIVNLPTGLTWTPGVTPPVYSGGSAGCFTVSGTTNAPCGQYTMLIYVTVNTGLGPFSGELTGLTTNFGVAGFEQEYLRVIASGNACPSVNTSPSGNYEAYGSCSSSGISVTISKTDVNCFGQATGSATANATGGSTYTYVWSNNGNSATISNLTAGTYTVTVTSNSQTATATVTITQPASAVSVSATTTTAACSSATGSATATATGGTPNYTYHWNNNINAALNNNITAGTYTVTVTDNKSCTASASATVSSASSLSVTINTTAVSCFGGTTGAATATATGNSGNVSYNWSNSTTSATASNLSAGTITVTVTDAGGCSASASATVTQPSAALTVSATATNTSCTSNTGTATATANGGTPSYTYNWSNSNAGGTISNLAVGNYIVTVTDNKGCTASATTSVASAANFTLNVSTTAVNCYGQSTGSATATVSGASGTVTYSWNTGGNTAAINNQSAGTYTVTATDGSGCSKSASGTITQPSVALAVSVSTTPSACGASTGSATATVTGNTGNPVYAWSNNSNTATISNLAAAIYNVTVTAGGCTATAAAAVNNSNGPTLNVLQTNPTCFGSTNGSATAVATGGQSPYGYVWNTGATGSSLTGVIAGTYTVIVTDNSGCAATGVVTLVQPDAITFNATTTNVNCNGALTGAASVNVAGGTGPYQYSWSTGTSSNAISNVAAGAYTITVTDSKSCTAVNTSTITQPAALTVNVTSTTSTGNNGTATATPAGGTSPYQYNWSNSQTTATATGLSVGTVNVTITDSKGCTVTGSSTVVVSGIEETTLANTVISVYPNPASDVLNVEVQLSNTHKVQFRIADATGKEVAFTSQTVSGSVKQPLSTSHLAAGVYVLEVNIDGFTTYRRFVIGR